MHCQIWNSLEIITFAKKDIERLKTFANVAPFLFRELIKNFNIKLFKYRVMIKSSVRIPNSAYLLSLGSDKKLPMKGGLRE